MNRKPRTMYCVQTSTDQPSSGWPPWQVPGPLMVMIAVSDPSTAATLGAAGARLAVRDGCSVLLFTALELRSPLIPGDSSIDAHADQRLAVSRAFAAVTNYDLPCRTEIDQCRLDWSAMSRRRQIAEQIAAHAAASEVDTIVVGSAHTTSIGRGLIQHLRRMTSAQVIEIPTGSPVDDSLAVVRRITVSSLWA